MRTNADRIAWLRDAVAKEGAHECQAYRDILKMCSEAEMLGEQSQEAIEKISWAEYQWYMANR